MNFLIADYLKTLEAAATVACQQRFRHVDSSPGTPSVTDLPLRSTLSWWYVSPSSASPKNRAKRVSLTKAPGPASTGMTAADVSTN